MISFLLLTVRNPVATKHDLDLKFRRRFQTHTSHADGVLATLIRVAPLWGVNQRLLSLNDTEVKSDPVGFNNTALREKWINNICPLFPSKRKYKNLTHFFIKLVSAEHLLCPKHCTRILTKKAGKALTPESMDSCELTKYIMVLTKKKKKKHVLCCNYYTNDQVQLLLPKGSWESTWTDSMVRWLAQDPTVRVWARYRTRSPASNQSTHFY